MAKNLQSPAFALALLVLAFGVGVACGDGPDAPGSTGIASPGPAGGSAPTPPIGPPPQLGTYVTAISPGNGEKVTQESTRSPDPSRPKGVCFSASFSQTPEQGQWFRIAVDGEEVTTKLTWIVGSTNAPESGRGCYAPKDGLRAGRHTAAVTVQNPRNFSEPARQTVAWVFDVE